MVLRSLGYCRALPNTIRTRTSRFGDHDVVTLPNIGNSTHSGFSSARGTWTPQLCCFVSRPWSDCLAQVQLKTFQYSRSFRTLYCLTNIYQRSKMLRERRYNLFYGMFSELPITVRVDDEIFSLPFHLAQIPTQHFSKAFR